MTKNTSDQTGQKNIIKYNLTDCAEAKQLSIVLLRGSRALKEQNVKMFFYTWSEKKEQ